MIYSSALTRGGAPAESGRLRNVISKRNINLLVIFTKKNVTNFSYSSIVFFFFFLLMTIA